MVLLNPADGFVNSVSNFIFTFQYGSIKSATEHVPVPELTHFTFQYGSIKSVENDKAVYYENFFTFQYGSIKSISSRQHKPYNIGLYIPVWFY